MCKEQNSRDSRDSLSTVISAGRTGTVEWRTSVSRVFVEMRKDENMKNLMRRRSGRTLG